MDSIKETLEELMNVVEAMDEKLIFLEKKMGKLSSDMDVVQSGMQGLSERMDVTQKKALVFDKIEAIADQVSELRSLIYEAGLVVVGPDRIEELEKRLEKGKPVAVPGVPKKR